MLTGLVGSFRFDHVLLREIGREDFKLVSKMPGMGLLSKVIPNEP